MTNRRNSHNGNANILKAKIDPTKELEVWLKIEVKQKPESPPKRSKIPRIPKPLKKSSRDNMKYVEQAPSVKRKTKMTVKPAFRRKTSQGSVVFKKNVLKETIEISHGNVAEMKALEVMMPQDGADGYYMDLPKF